MTEMVDRVMRAMSAYKDTLPKTSDDAPFIYSHRKGLALAAIGAMREPTREVVRRVERAFKSFEVIAGSATTKEPQWLIRKTDAPGGEWIGLFNSETWARTECDRMNTLTAITAMIDAALRD